MTYEYDDFDPDLDGDDTVDERKSEEETFDLYLISNTPKAYLLATGQLGGVARIHQIWLPRSCCRLSNIVPQGSFKWAKCRATVKSWLVERTPALMQLPSISL